MNGHPTIKGGGSVHTASVENFQTFTSPEHIHNETINTSSCNMCHQNMAVTINNTSNSTRPLTSASSTATESYKNHPKAVIAPKIQGKHIKPQNQRLKVNKQSSSGSMQLRTHSSQGGDRNFTQHVQEIAAGGKKLGKTLSMQRMHQKSVEAEQHNLNLQSPIDHVSKVPAVRKSGSGLPRGAGSRLGKTSQAPPR